MRTIKHYSQFLHEARLFENEGDKVIVSFIGALKAAQEAEESPRGSNKGEKVQSMQTSVKTKPGNPWCAAFLYHVLSETGLAKLPVTASVKSHWEKSTAKKITFDEIKKDPGLIKPGMAFFYLTKSSEGDYPGPGHTGIILSTDPKKKTITSVEGNTNPLDGAREGYGVFLVTRSIEDPSISKDPKEHPAKMLGVIDYFSDYRGAEFDKKMEEECEKIIKEVLSPKTEKEKSYLSSNPSAFKEYEENYANRNS